MVRWFESSNHKTSKWDKSDLCDHTLLYETRTSIDTPEREIDRVIEWKGEDREKESERESVRER